MTKRVKVGVIGVGRMGERHVKMYRRSPDVELVAVADADRSRAEEVAKEYAIPHAYGDFTKLLAHKEIDAVSIATPDSLHVEPTVASAEAGKHILLEKPIATTLEDADAILKAAKRAAVKVMIGYTARFFPQFGQVKGLIGSGKIGEVLLSRIAWFNGPIEFPKEFYEGGLPPRRDSIITFLATHPVDLIRWYMGEVERVYCEADTFTWGKNQEGPDDTASISLRFRNGKIGHVMVCWAFSGAPCRARFVADVIGQEGIIQSDSMNDGLMVSSAKSGYELPIHYDWVEPVRAELEHFIECVALDRQPIVTGEDGRQTLAVTLAAIESARTHRPISM